ncbi:MAG TPA: hypothetical protein VL049_26760, partial [Candidatus Dormibacteraeota bacterium]|nr:hypothetical protein [Candidatus Dormibacteraeota bacterium]
AQLHALATAGGLPMREGVMRCSATMLASRADKHAAAAGGALAVEMEGGPIASAARLAGRPFVAVRAVIVGAADDLSLLARVGDPDSGQVRPLALLAHLLREPPAIKELRELRRAQVAARDALRRFFVLWLAPP